MDDASLAFLFSDKNFLISNNNKSFLKQIISGIFEKISFYWVIKAQASYS